MKATNQNDRNVIDVQAEETDITGEVHAPRHLTLRQNVILTIKVLGSAGVVVAALWGINLWTSAR
jgi:hypothetical protein